MRSKGSGFDYLTGWITAIWFWDVEGRRLYGDADCDVPLRHRFSRRQGPRIDSGEDDSEPVALDGVLYSKVDSEAIPAGYV